MYRNRKIGIVIPAYNEENFIVPTLKGLPKYLDSIVVINDGSKDKTAQKVKSLQDSRIVLLENKKNEGLGFSIKRGFAYLIENSTVTIVCITAGDNQFEGSYLTPMVDAVIDQKADYAKSNRFLDKLSLYKMPTHRLIGNVVFTLLTKFASGYYSIFDTLNAFSATRIELIRAMNLNEIDNRYDFEISYLMQHAYLNSRVKDFFTPIRYAEEVSDINYTTFVIRNFRTLTRGLFRRIMRNYVIYNFHPIALFFFSGFVMALFGLLYGFGIISYAHLTGPRTPTTATVMLSVVPFILGIQFILQAIVLDIQNEPK